MTRRDLEEVIVNLEYLLQNHFDKVDRQECERLLQQFRRELQALMREPRHLAPIWKGKFHRAA